MKFERIDYYYIYNKILIKYTDKGTYKYENGKWVRNFEWIPKIFIESFWDYEEIDENKALELIKMGVV